MAKKLIHWVIINGDGKPLWGDEDVCRTREDARESVYRIKQNIFEPWYENVTLPLKILRREWAVVDEREIR